MMNETTLLRAAGVLVTGLWALTAPASAATYETNKISFRDITGTVEIVTTSSDELDIEIRQGKTYQTLEVVQKDGVLIVSGEKWREEETRNCCSSRISREFIDRKGAAVTADKPVDEAFFADYPTIIVSMPFVGDVEFMDARIKLKMDRLAGALSLDACYVYGETGDLDEAVIGVIDGSRLVIGDVKAGLEIDVSGNADILTGDAAMADIDIAGPGDVILGDIDGMLDVSIAGSGVVRSTYVDGPMTVRIAGSGGVAVKDGRADKLKATIDGSGGVYFGGVVNQPELRLFGSSEVRMNSVEGRIAKHGGGAVYVGDEVFSDD